MPNEIKSLQNKAHVLYARCHIVGAPAAFVIHWQDQAREASALARALMGIDA